MKLVLTLVHASENVSEVKPSPDHSLYNLYRRYIPFLDKVSVFPAFTTLYPSDVPYLRTDRIRALSTLLELYVSTSISFTNLSNDILRPPNLLPIVYIRCAEENSQTLI